MILNEIFKNILVINLKQMSDRYESFQQEMSKYNIEKYHRIFGSLVNNGSTFMDRIKGNKESHLECIRYAKKNKLKYVIICEDDVVFNSKWTNHQNLLTDINNFMTNEKWELFYFGCTFVDPPTNTNYKYIMNLTRSWAIHCYAVHSSVYDLILDYSNDPIYNDPTFLPCDCYYYELLQKRGLCYICKPRLAAQREGFSFAESSQINYSWLWDNEE